MPWSDGRRSGVYHRSGAGTETGNAFPTRQLSSENDPNPNVAVLDLEPRPETISDPSNRIQESIQSQTLTLHRLVCRRHRSGANLRTRHWSGVETGSESGRQVGRRPKDIFYEERKKMTDFLHKKDSWLADYYLQERHHIWRLVIFIFCIWISDVHSD